MKLAKTMRISSLFYIACGVLIGIYAANNFQARDGSDMQLANLGIPEFVDSADYAVMGN